MNKRKNNATDPRDLKKVKREHKDKLLEKYKNKKEKTRQVSYL